MSSEPTRRFSSRVEDYIRYRPSYPAEVVAYLCDRCHLTPESTIVDMGSGTGISAKLFLEAGLHVIGVEPNAEMRNAAETLLRGFESFTSVDGTAEATTLPPDSADLVLAAQAFHWFDHAKTRQEFRRILKPEGFVALLWNERLVDTTPFLAGYEELLKRYATDYDKVDHRRVDRSVIQQFFEHDDFERIIFPNAQEFDYEALEGRLRSSSYTPERGTAAFTVMTKELKHLFDAHNKHGKVSFLYDSILYLGQLPHSFEN